MFTRFKQGRLERQHKPNVNKRALSLCLASALVAGCGGSGGSSGPQTLTGVFIDSPVEGVSYSTPTQSGTTNAAGEFSYEAGEQVTFALGSLELGSADGNSEVTVFDIAGVQQMPTTLREFEDSLFPPNGERTPFERAINLAVLLQTLDEDNDPANGIRINDATAALVSSDEIDLSMRYYDFRRGGNGRDGRGLQGLVRAAVDAGALSARAPRNVGSAINHALAQAGQPISYYIARVHTQDNGNDGTINYRREVSYDASGYYLGDRVDTNGDGTINRSTNYEYGAEGLRTLFENDSDGDGTPNSTEIRGYNSFGDLTLLESRNAGVLALRDAWTHDAQGRLVEQQRSIPSGDSAYYWRIDENGMRSTYDIDFDGDGVIDRRDLLSYGTQTRGDRWIRREMDTDNDGTMDGLQIREFDANGNLIFDELDSDNDGTPDYRNVSEFSDNRLVLFDSVRANGRGYTQRWTVDASGRTTQYTYDGDRDGVPDQISTYTYDSAGNTIEQVSDSDGDGNPNNRYAYVYDASGNQIESTVDNGADGVIDQRTVFTYDAQGRRTSYTVDRGADGTIDTVNEYSDWIDIGIGRYL